MKNISFDNPYLLLILIPLLLFVLVPICWAIRKENRSKSVVASTVLHIVIALCITLAAGGMIFTSVMTQTQIVVVADVSYSGNRDLEQVEAYIQEIKNNLPRNSKMGVVVFAKEAKVYTEMGAEHAPLVIEENGVKKPQHGFNTSQTASTDISAALNYASTLFDDDVIKRVILISDGKQTRTEATGELVGAVENLYANNIYIDAIFMDSNLSDDVKEVQISDVEYVSTTYKDHKTYANILIQSTYDTNSAVLTFSDMNSSPSVILSQKVVDLHKGYNVINFALPTELSGSFSYEFAIDASVTGDVSSYNNRYEFSQTIVENMNVLVITGNAADEARIQETYPENTKFEFKIQKSGKKLDVPCTVDELCKFDEIIISSIDIRDLNNVTAFVDALDTVVSQFGKSLVTMGDLRIQNKTDNDLLKLENLLPVKYGNNSQDPKLFTIVLDVSRSMQNFSRLRIAKAAAQYLVGTLTDQDYAMLILFWGDHTLAMTPSCLGAINAMEVDKTNRDVLLEKIANAEPYQGTMLMEALETAEKNLAAQEQNFSEMQIMLISDGMTWSTEEDDPTAVVKRVFDTYATTTSVIHPAGQVEDLDITDPDTEPNGNPKLLMELAQSGGGKYYGVYRESDLLEVMFGQVMDDVTQSVVVGDNLQVQINEELKKDGVLAGLKDFPSVQGYVNSKAKASAKAVLTVDYTKASGTVVEVPLYAYWNYGNGKVSSFTSTLTGEWSQNWQGETGKKFFSNVAAENVPQERIDRPYSLNVKFDGAYSQVEIIPVVLNPKAVATMTVTAPNGTKTTQTLIFDSSRYYYQFETPVVGNYTIEVSYEYDGKVYKARTVYAIPYAPEYNAFEVFDPATLHAAIRNRGTVIEDGIPSLKNNDKEVTTYMLPLIVPLMAMAVALYVIDIIVRKLKISDIKSFFGIKPRKGAGK